MGEYVLENKLDNGATVLGLFPTPIYCAEIPKELSVAANFFDTLEHREGDHVMEYGSHSKNTYVLQEPECKDLADWIMTQVKKYADEILMYDYDEYAFSQTWVTWKSPGQYHTLHTHPNSLISACFYYGYGDENTPSITFHRPNGSITSATLSPKYKADRRPSAYSWETFQVPFTPGTICMFPSYFLHHVPINNTNYIRKGLAMNILPKGKIGDPDSLTELLFDKVM